MPRPEAAPAAPAALAPPAAPEAAAHRLWGGRFDAGPAEALAALNRSLAVDHRLWPYDVAAGKAWVAALREAGVVAPGEATALLGGLDRVAELLADGAAVGAPDEDVHTLVERLLYEQVGEVAGKLNTGRSRNDQVATDLRMWCRDALAAVDAEVAALGRTLVARAAQGVEFLLPGYTHQQRAQPVRWAFVLLAHAWPLVRDRERLGEIGRRVNCLPLGSSALAGSGVPVNRVLLKETLGFHALAENALDATGDRDFVAEVLFALSLVATHLSRLGDELITYASSEYGFVRLDDAYATGSSLLPQKRNPDVFELARGKAATVIGDLTGVLALLKGLPAGYSKDLQEDKALLFRSVDAMLVTLPAVRGAVATLEPVPAKMAAALDAGLLATDLADGLVHAGVPFRDAHHLVGRAVRLAEELGVPLTALPQGAAREIHPALPALVGSLGSWEDSVERRAGVGGSSRAAVATQIEELERAFRSDA